MTHDQDSPDTSAPDLQILGDEITLQPSGYVEPPKSQKDFDKEEALMQHYARFRSEPLQYDTHTPVKHHEAPQLTIIPQVPSRSVSPRIRHRMARV
jgi:hypothetical protein